MLMAPVAYYSFDLTTYIKIAWIYVIYVVFQLYDDFK